MVVASGALGDTSEVFEKLLHLLPQTFLVCIGKSVPRVEQGWPTYQAHIDEISPVELSPTKHEPGQAMLDLIVLTFLPPAPKADMLTQKQGFVGMVTSGWRWTRGSCYALCSQCFDGGMCISFDL
jgi:hypothetical protein